MLLLLLLLFVAVCGSGARGLRTKRGGGCVCFLDVARITAACLHNHSPTPAHRRIRPCPLPPSCRCPLSSTLLLHLQFLKDPSKAAMGDGFQPRDLPPADAAK